MPKFHTVFEIFFVSNFGLLFNFTVLY